MKNLIILTAICCVSNIYAQDKMDIHNQLFTKLYNTPEVTKLKKKGLSYEATILKEDALCDKINCALFSKQNQNNFPIRDYEDMFVVGRKHYIVVEKIDYEKKTLSVYVKFKGSLTSNKLKEDFTYVTVQL